MSLVVACQHSIAQLKLLESAAERQTAEQALLDLQVNTAASVAAWDKGQKATAVANELIKALTGKEQTTQHQALRSLKEMFETAKKRPRRTPKSVIAEMKARSNG